MIKAEEILSLNYLKKADFTGSNAGMRYRLSKGADEGGAAVLLCCIWPEPYNFFSTPAAKKEFNTFSFDADGIQDAVAWMNDKLFAEKEKWDSAASHWDQYDFISHS